MPKSKSKGTYKVQVNDEMWTCRVWKSKVYEKMYGADSYAITDIEKRIIDFRDDSVTVEICSHELMHAYFKYLHLDSVANPKIEDIEEIYASWIGANLTKFYHKVNLIHSTLKEYGVTTK